MFYWEMDFIFGNFPKKNIQMISRELKDKFEKIIEIKDLDWKIIEEIVMSDANILRPIMGVAFEEYLRKILIDTFPKTIIEDGLGDSDIDLIVDGHTLQLKTPNNGTTKTNVKIGVALHKTHGDETRPNNLYKVKNKTFEYLVVFHPESGVLIVPYDKIPTHSKYPDCLADPASFIWNSEWLNHWELLGYIGYKGKTIDKRIIPSNSELPFLSSKTFLEDYEIIEMLCKPEYFRAAVMGLKGNIKEHWFVNELKKLNYDVYPQTESYAKYDLKIMDHQGVKKRIQVKGTSKNMCSLKSKTIGFEIMGTHGQFPHRGYKKSTLDYVAIIISEEQLSEECKLKPGLNFIIIPIEDLPFHYLIGNGISNKEKGHMNEKWNKEEYSDIIYPNIKL